HSLPASTLHSPLLLTYDVSYPSFSLFLFNDPAPTDIYTLSLHDALPICLDNTAKARPLLMSAFISRANPSMIPFSAINSIPGEADRKSTRLNSSHVSISYAVFCLKKKNIKNQI